MTDNVTLQELFDSQAGFTPKDVSLLLDFNNLWDTHKKDIGNDTFTAKYYEQLDGIADKYHLEYTMPKHIGTLTEVGSSPVLH